MRRAAFLVALSGLVGALSLTAADAANVKGARRQLPSGLGSSSDPYWGRLGGYICRRWCIEDRNPCDPARYKDADGRCSGTRNFYGALNCRIENETRPECPTFSPGR